MKNCCVPLCNSRAGTHEKISFHKFPLKKEMKAAWLRAIARRGEKDGSLWEPSEHSVVCNKHFQPSDYSVSTKVRKLLPNSIPSIFPNYPSYLVSETTRKRKPPCQKIAEPEKKRCTGSVNICTPPTVPDLDQSENSSENV